MYLTWSRCPPSTSPWTVLQSSPLQHDLWNSTFPSLVVITAALQAWFTSSPHLELGDGDWYFLTTSNLKDFYSTFYLCTPVPLTQDSLLPEQTKQDLTVPLIAGTLCAINTRIIPNAGNFIADFDLEVKSSKKNDRNLIKYNVLCCVVTFICFVRISDFLGERKPPKQS